MNVTFDGNGSARKSDSGKISRRAFIAKPIRGISTLGSATSTSWRRMAARCWSSTCTGTPRVTAQRLHGSIARHRPMPTRETPCCRNVPNKPLLKKDRVPLEGTVRFHRKPGGEDESEGVRLACKPDESPLVFWLQRRTVFLGMIGIYKAG